MDRRTFLHATGLLAAFTAGCTGEKSADTTISTTQTEQPKTTKQPTETTPQTTAASTTTTAEPETTTETTTVSSEDVAAEQIQTAKTTLEEAITTYAYFGGKRNASILNVLAITESFNRQKIDPLLVDVRAALSNAESHAVENQQTTISKLREISHFLSQLAFAQAKLIKGYQHATDADDALHEAQWGEVWGSGGKTKSAGGAASTYLDIATEKSSPEACTVVENLSESTYKAKVEQIKQEATAIKTIGANLRKLRTGVKEYNRAVGKYNDEYYDSAETIYGTANEEFSTVVDSVESLDHKAPVQGIYSDVKCFCQALAGTSKHMQKASKAGHDDEKETQQDEEEKASNAFHSCGLVQEIMGEIY